MNRIDRYLLGLMAPPFFAALAGVMALLLLERMLRLISLVGESNGAIAYVFDLLASLIPHYLGLAAPAALFLACFVAFRRLAQTSELSAFASLGRGLGRLAAPALASALVLTLLSIVVYGYMQPYGRYAYRTGKFLLANASIAQALEAGAFIEHNGVTFMGERAAPGASGLGRVFVHERREDGARRTVTSTSAALYESPDGTRTAIAFADGVLVDEQTEGGRAVVRFDAFDWPIDRAALGRLRPRGDSEAELTMPELFRAYVTTPDGLKPARIASELHARLVRSLTVMAMPLLAIPLAVGGGRTRTSAPIVAGVIALLVYVQALQFAEELADLGRIPAGPTLWGLFLLFAGGSAAIFVRAWRGVGFEPTLWLPRPRRATRLRLPPWLGRRLAR